MNGILAKSVLLNILNSGSGAQLTDVPIIFISHIDEEHQLAQTIAGWLDNAFRESVRVVVGGRGIQKGQQWFDSLGADLHSAELIIALCSNESVKSNWLFFEAGTAWGRKKSMIPLCHSGMAPDLLPPQFAPFQSMIVDAKAKFAGELLDEISRKFDLKRVRPLDPDRAVNELKSSLDAISNESERIGLFVSIPLRSYSEDGSFDQHQGEVRKVLSAIDEYLHLDRVYFGGRKLVDGKVKTREPSLIAARDNMPALMKAQRFLMVYPERLATTSLTEAGIAFARGIPSVLFIRDPEDLPFGLRELHQFHGWGGRVNFYQYKETDDIIDIMRDYGAKLFAEN